MSRVFLGLADKSGLCRLEYYEVNDGADRPWGSGWATQVAELMPLRLRDIGGPAFIAANMIPLLADALAKMKQPRGAPDPLTRPVWATLQPEILEFIRAQVPGFHVEGRYGWMDTLKEARDLFAPQRRNFHAVAVEDVDSFLPLYREIYSAQMKREDVERVLRGDDRGV